MFSNPVLGGTVLVRTAEQSANYVAGTSGWRITRAGNAEFNTATIRGSVTSGTTPGQHFIINAPATGTMAIAYDASNREVFRINAVGDTIWALWDGSGVHTQDLEINGLGVFSFSRTDTSEVDQFFTPSAGVATQAEWDITVFNNSLATPLPYQLRMLAGSDDKSKGATMLGFERGVGGSVVQSTGVSSANLETLVAVSGTTDASGFLTFTHNAGFRDAAGNLKAPDFIFTQAHGAGTPAFGHCTLVDGSITTTQAKVLCTNNNGTTRTSASVTFWAWCKG